jgi:hypothetical protein
VDDAELKRRHPFSIVVLALWAVACLRPPASDRERYLAERRAAGMSEEAEGALRLIANVLAGRDVVTYEKQADGLYLVEYSNTLCVRPGVDAKQVEALRAKSRVAAEAQLEKLKTLADTDRSGFVSTAEGARVQQLVSFAWEATFVAEHEPTPGTWRR